MSSIALRHHIGGDHLPVRRNHSVFINCPFDAEFGPVFDAIVFSTVCCGFMPRSALESGTASRPRMARITSAVQSSKYSVHDLSRCRGEGELNLARFNMPLELGIAMGERFRDEASADAHDWLVLVPDSHAYHRLVSDLSGYDPIEYDGAKESVVPAVMSWLATRPDAVQTPTPAAVLAALPRLEAELEELRMAWNARTPWSDTLMRAMAVAAEAGLVPRPAARDPSAS